MSFPAFGNAAPGRTVQLALWACAYACFATLSLPVFSMVTVDAAANSAQRESQPCDEGFVLNQDTGACEVEQPVPVQSRQTSTTVPRPVEPTQPTAVPARPTALPAMPTEPPTRPTLVPADPTAPQVPDDFDLIDPCDIDQGGQQDSSCPKDPEITIPSQSLSVANTNVLMFNIHCANVSAGYATLQDAQSQCTASWGHGEAFTLTSASGSESDITHQGKDGLSALASWGSVPHGAFSISKTSLAGTSTISVFCGQSYPVGDGTTAYEYPEPMPITAPGTIEGVIDHPGESGTVWCFWFNIPDINSVAVSVATVPVLIPKDIPQLAPICGPELSMARRSNTCVPPAPADLESLPLINADLPIDEETASSFEPELTMPAGSLLLGSSTVRVITMNCATYDSGWGTITAAYAECDESEALGQGLTLTSAGVSKLKVTTTDTTHGASAVWTYVPEGPFTIVADANPESGSPIVFCSWEAQNTDAAELEYSVAYDLLMPVSNDGSLEGIIDYPGTDYLCVWFNIPEPVRADPNG